MELAANPVRTSTHAKRSGAPRARAIASASSARASRREWSPAKVTSPAKQRQQPGPSGAGVASHRVEGGLYEGDSLIVDVSDHTRHSPRVGQHRPYQQRRLPGVTRQAGRLEQGVAKPGVTLVALALSPSPHRAATRAGRWSSPTSSNTSSAWRNRPSASASARAPSACSPAANT